MEPVDVWNDVSIGKAGTPDRATMAQVMGELRTNSRALLVLAKELTGKDFTDEAAIAQAVIAALPSAQAIADAIPATVAQEVVDLLAARLAA